MAFGLDRWAHVAALRERLVGRTVAAVEEPEGHAECVCRIRTSDGASFRLHATDLGAWVEDDVRADGTYPSLRALSQACAAHRYNKAPDHGFELPEASVRTEGGTLTFDAFDGTEFRTRLEDLTEEERTVAEHPEGIRMLRMAADGMDFWPMAFRNDSEDCPEELRGLFQGGRKE